MWTAAYLCSINKWGCREITEQIYGPSVSPLCGECQACVLCCECPGGRERAAVLLEEHGLA